MTAYGQVCVGIATGSTNTLSIATNATLRTICIKTGNATADDVANNTVNLDGGTIQAITSRTADFVAGAFNV